MYTLYYSDTSAEGGCSDSDTIHNSLCNEGICRHDFQVSSSCLPSNDITMSVFATNILGTGPHLTQLITGIIHYYPSCSTGILLYNHSNFR